MLAPYIIVTLILILATIFVLNPHLLNLLRFVTSNIEHYKVFPYIHIKSHQPQPIQKSQYFPVKIPDPVLAQKIKENKTLAFLVIKDNQLITEEYFGIDQNTLIYSFSAAKSVLSVLTGIAIDKKILNSLDQPVAPFFPDLKLFPKLTIRHLLTMSSGLKWNEAFRNPFSDVIKAFFTTDLWQVVKNTKSIYPPGTQFSYKCINSILLGMILAKAAQTPLNEFIEKHLWTPMGAEHDALWITDKKGIVKSFCCLYATARDYAKFGLVLLNKGQFNGNQIVSQQYIQQMLTPASNLHDKNGDPVDYYGLHIWFTHYRGKTIPYIRGMFGQYIFILPEENAIFVRLGSKHKITTGNQTPQDAFLYLDTGYKILDQLNG